LLEGKNVNLRVVEKEDLPVILKWVNNVDFVGEYEPISQETKQELDKEYEGQGPDRRWFLIEKKDKTAIGYIAHFLAGKKYLTIAYALIPSERAKGYGSEAVQLLVDYLFLSNDVPRIEAQTHPENLVSQHILEKAGFKREGTMRKCFFSRGVWRDTALFGILREEWKEQKILTRTA
jgi:RimJ/RimL family protein N-acetyltransferase